MSKMASALRKLLRSSDKMATKSEKQEAIGGAPTPRRLFARACSSVGLQGYRDATKVSPAEVPVPLQMASGAGSGAAAVVKKDHAANVSTTTTTTSAKGSKKGGTLMNDSTASHARLVRTRRLMREFQEMCKHQRETETPIFTVELAEDNLYEWVVKLHIVDPESDLHKDMVETNTPYILLSLTFPDNFPFAPPFMRVITPRIEKGFVMEGGAICMELLTPSGWASAYTVEAVITQFGASLVKGQGRIARKTKGVKDFNRKTAEASFRSLVKTHEKYGWVTPPLADG